MSERKEPTSELYQWALVYAKLVNVMFIVIDIGGLCLLMVTR